MERPEKHIFENPIFTVMTITQKSVSRTQPKTLLKCFQ